MAAKVDPDDMLSYHDMGVDHVSPKPFDPITLAEQIQEVWNKVGVQQYTLATK
jgi:DNA-binding response OmpR family regulator